MNRVLLYSGWSVFVALVLLSFGCGSGSTNSGPFGPVISTPKTYSSLVFTTSVPQGSYTRGVVIPITFTVANIGTQPANLQIGTCNDFVIDISKGGQLVWSGPSGGCGGVIRSVVIAPGATMTYNVNWHQVDQQENAVPTGTYTVVARLTPSTLNGNDVRAPQGTANFTGNPISVSIAP